MAFNPLDPKTLEQKLKKVKEEVSKIVSLRELTSGEYIKIVLDLLAKESLIDDSYEAFEFGIHVLANLSTKLGLKRFQGFSSDYLYCKGVKLSKETKEDIKKYADVKKSIEAYLKINVKDKIYESEFYKLIEDYLAANFPEISEFRRKELAALYAISLEKKFRVEPDPKKIGGYDAKTLEKVLEKL
jgi:hypothetical protein